MLREVEASTYIRVPGKLVYSVLAAYQAYQEWNPEVAESRVFASEGEVSIVELIVPTLARGKLILEYVESPRIWLFFNQVDRLREDGFAGRWDLTDADDGKGVVVNGVLSSKDGILRIGVRRRLRSVLDRTLSALKSHCLMLAAAGGTGDSRDRVKILEIRRADGKVELDLDDQRFIMGLLRSGEAS